MLTALDLGLICGLMALGVCLTFQVLDIASLTVDLSFTTDAVVAAVMITAGQNPWLATLGGFLAGYVVGTVTGLLHVNAGIHPLSVGTLTQTGLYSTNLRTLGKVNVPLLRDVKAPLALSRDKGLLGSWISILIFTVLIVIITILFNWFLSTQIGLGMHSTGGNEGMARAQGISTGTAKIIGLALSNDLVTSSGAVITQYQGCADISMGIGLIVTGFASVIVGIVLIGSQGVWTTFLFVVIGSIVYRVIIQLALGVESPEANGMKLISAIAVFATLMIPRIGVSSKIHKRHRNRSLAPESDITHAPEERDSEKVMF